MKKSIIIIIISLFQFQLFSQLISTEYFEKKYKGKQVIFKQIYLKPDSSYRIKRFYRDGNLLYEGNYSSIYPSIENGEFIFYHPNGFMSAKGNYKDGKLIGKCYKYDKNGQQTSFSDYDFELKISKINSITDDTSNKKLILVDQMPTFQGGDINKFRDYLQSKIFIPPMANIEGICGKVIASFVIDEQGNICNIEILESPYKDFDQEVKRLLSNSPNWEPGISEGNQIKVAITMPIIFLIE